jgi:hypothetical protein
MTDTLFFPDISSYEAGLTIQPGTVAVIAKATEGTNYRDAQYANFKSQAARVGAVFSAYHFLRTGNGAAQADYCHAMVGDTPVMLDVETEGSSKPTVADCLAFITRMHALGGRVWGAYFPRWYWEQVGGNLGSLGVAIVASGYPGRYSDTDANWKPYGGATPLIWQYTNAQAYGGQHVDFNAFRGTADQLATLINGTPTPTGGTVMPNIPPSIGQKWPEIAADFPANATYDDDSALIWADGGARAAALYAKQARDAITALAAKVQAPTQVDVKALASALAPLLAQTPAPTADQIATAVVSHLATALAKG